MVYRTSLQCATRKTSEFGETSKLEAAPFEKPQREAAGVFYGPVGTFGYAQNEEIEPHSG